MFEKLEDAPRTPTGALRNPWVDAAATGLIRLVVAGHIALAQAHLSAIRQAWHEAGPEHEICKLRDELALDIITTGVADDLSPEDATEHDTYADVQAALSMIANWRNA